ncbi:MAG: hypothetical protein JSS49_15615 [Planctomycetes bacterium]|nr:hypothetical protein [Planctomycetota bacterium]
MNRFAALSPRTHSRIGARRVESWPSLISILAHLHWPWMAGLIAVAFSIPAWSSGFQLDDFYHQAILRNDLELGAGSPILDLFTWSIGDADRNRADMERGLLPWWAPAEFRMKYFRPLAAATHLVDQWLWPRQKWLMHVHSSLWFAAASVAVGFLFRRLFSHADEFSPAANGEFARTRHFVPPMSVRGPWTTMSAAGLASLIYALRDEHAVTVAWIANRNLLMMTFFGALAWLCHSTWRERHSRVAGVAAPILFGTSLLCGESAVAIGGCLLAHALVLDRATWWRKFLSLLPCGLVGVVWLVSYRTLQFGASESGSYLDPASDLPSFLVGFAQRAPVYFASSFGLMSATIFTFADASQQSVVVLASVLMSVAMGCIVWPTIRRDKLMRFFAVCLVLAVVPLCAGLATDRLTMIFNIPASGLIARFVQLKRNEANLIPKHVQCSWFGRRLAKFWILLHTAVAAVLLPILILGFGASGNDLLAAARSRSLNHPELAKQNLIMLNAPHGMYPLYLDFARLDEGLSRARCTHLLSSALCQFDVSRPDSYSLELTIPEGLLNDAFSMLYRNPTRQPMVAGTRINLPRFTVTVLESSNGKPTRVAYRFSEPLEDPSLCLVEWRDSEFVPFDPPPVGTNRSIPQACGWTVFHIQPVLKVLGLQ